MSTDLDGRLAAARARVAARLDAALRDDAGTLGDAMRHALQGGKGFRAFLVIESAGLHDVPAGAAVDAAAAVEALHAYSLVHDDLPCMDDDDMRRGRPTVHRRWSEAVAVLAGDALQALAFELVADVPHAPEMVRSLAVAAGRRGMVGGQWQDIAAEGMPRALTLDEITAMQAGKTGALLAWSASAGARMAGAAPAALEAYGRAIGLAFQIVDDILDVEGDPALLGKAVGKDAAAGKATFVSALGLEGARARAARLVEEAEAALAGYGPRADALRAAARFVISRAS